MSTDVWPHPIVSMRSSTSLHQLVLFFGGARSEFNKFLPHCASHSNAIGVPYLSSRPDRYCLFPLGLRVIRAWAAYQHLHGTM
jgi:hypothetical protein